MKKILFLTVFACLTLFAKAQKITIDLDSISDNKVFIESFKWQKSKDTLLVVQYKVNGLVYGNNNLGNFNMTFEWKLDSVKGVTAATNRIKAEKEVEIRELEAKLLRAYEKNKDVNPNLQKDKIKTSAQPKGLIGDVPKSYDYSVGFKPIEVQTKKRKWWQRKK